jgi:hypothetical protein
MNAQGCVERKTAEYVNALPNGSLHELVSDGIGTKDILRFHLVETF